jgi:beta-lactamase regulating signal transducer with metallopeptidase domain
VETFVYAGLGNAAAATVLALLAAGLGRVVRRPALAHSLWLLVLLKLLTPPLLALPVLGPAPHGGAPEKAALGGPSGESPAEPDSLASLTAGPEPGTGESSPDAPTGLPRWEIVLAVVWLTGCAMWWAVAGVRLCRFHRLLRQARPAPPLLQEQVREFAGRLGLTRCPAVWLVSAPLPPLVWALAGAPRLVLPAALWEQLTPQQRAALLTHELAHLRRRDHWVRRLELLALGLYWWHPVAWWARREIQEAEEQCCDAWVVWALPEAAPVYAEALVETVAFLSRARTVLPVGASGVGQVKCLRRRLTMILSQTTPRSLSRAGCWAVVALGAALLPWGPTWAQAPAPDALFLVQFQDGGTVPPVPLRGGEPHGDVRAEARDTVELLKARLDSRRAELQEVMARLKQAEHELARLEPIRPPAASPSTGDGTGSILPMRETDEKALDKARAEVDILKARLAGKKAQVREAEVYLRQAQRRLEGLQHPTALEAEKLRELEQKLDQLRAEMLLLRGELRPTPLRNGSLAPSPSTVILTVNHRAFKLPIAIDPSQRPRLKELILYASTDEGRTWRQAAVASPDQDAFLFTAPADGLYWFTVRTVDQEGRLDPPSPQSRPAQQIQVRTQGEPKKAQAPGPPPRAVRVGQIIITGNVKTSSDVILKEVSLSPGQVLSYPALRKAEKNLAKLNVFVVDPKKGVRPTVTVIDADTDGEFKDIVIQVQEK